MSVVFDFMYKVVHRVTSCETDSMVFIISVW